MYNPKLTEMKYIGIDVSKAKLDLALLDENRKVLEQTVVKNTAKAILGKLALWKHEHAMSTTECLACFEPTGHYSNTVLRTLVGAQVPTWMAHPMEIKLRMGLVRGKNDKVDALRIADYAMRHQDKKRLAGPDTVAVLELKELLAFRMRLVVDVGRHKVFNTDLYPSMGTALRSNFSAYSRRRITQVKRMSDKVDALIKELITADPVMRQQYELLLTVDRVGPVLAAALIAATERFTRMTDARQLACHAGVAPHDHTSGSSVHGRARVSHHADKYLKSLLHMAVLGTASGKGELGAYYERKVAEGKNAMSVLNAIRNKVIRRVCAVIKRGTPYQLRQPETA